MLFRSIWSLHGSLLFYWPKKASNKLSSWRDRDVLAYCHCSMGGVGTAGTARLLDKNNYQELSVMILSLLRD